MSMDTAPITTQPMQGNLAVANNAATSTQEIVESDFNTEPLQIIPKTVQEEIYQTRNFAINENGDEYYLNNTSYAFSTEGYTEVFQERMQQTIENMVNRTKSNSVLQPVISLQNVDYSDFSLRSNKEFYSVDAHTLQRFKTSPSIKEAGFTVYGKPIGQSGFELVAYNNNTGKPVSGSEWNGFFDTFNPIIEQELLNEQIA